MSYTMNPPDFPTHTVRHTDNWDGEGDVLISLAFVVDDDYYHFDGGAPVIEYKGDVIHKIWELN